MFNTLATKLALRKAGLNNISMPSFTSKDSSSSSKSNDSSILPPMPNIDLPKITLPTVTVPKAFQSWQASSPAILKLRETPVAVGDKAPWNVKLRVPDVDGRNTIVVFLRFCGCPFTELLFQTLLTISRAHPSVQFIAISHCTPAATARWLSAFNFPYPPTHSLQQHPYPNVSIIVDTSRELYALWGLGTAGYAHVLNPRCGVKQVRIMMARKNSGGVGGQSGGNGDGDMEKKANVWGQEVGEGACRWQIGGAWGVDGRGMVRWGGAMKSVDEEVDLEAGVRSLEGGNGGGGNRGGYGGLGDRSRYINDLYTGLADLKS